MKRTDTQQASTLFGFDHGRVRRFGTAARTVSTLYNKHVRFGFHHGIRRFETTARAVTTFSPWRFDTQRKGFQYENNTITMAFETSSRSTHPSLTKRDQQSLYEWETRIRSNTSRRGDAAELTAQAAPHWKYDHTLPTRSAKGQVEVQSTRSHYPLLRTAT